MQSSLGGDSWKLHIAGCRVSERTNGQTVQVLGEEVSQVELGRRIAQVDVLVPNMFFNPVIGDLDMLVAQGDSVDAGPLLGCDVVADQKRWCRHYGRDADSVEGGHEIEALLEVRGPKDNPVFKRYWRVKWKGEDENGNDLWPDEGMGDGSGFNWQAEEYLDGDRMQSMMHVFWRANWSLDQFGDNVGPAD